MKLIGITMIFFSLCAVGFYRGEKYISVLKDIKRVDKFLGNIIFGLQNEKMTVSEIFENSALCGDEKTKLFLKNMLPQNFKKSEKIAKESGFCSSDTANSILSEVFFVLGKYSAKEQIKEIEFCRSKIKNLYEKSEEALLAKAKLSRYSGILAGMFFAIIML